jgi:hypothetical protein
VLLKYIRGEDVKARTLLGYEIIGRESTKDGKEEKETCGI